MRSVPGPAIWRDRRIIESIQEPFLLPAGADFTFRPERQGARRLGCSSLSLGAFQNPQAVGLENLIHRSDVALQH
jgi:hypothetical protein